LDVTFVKYDYVSQVLASKDYVPNLLYKISEP